ncbi:MAG: urease accessory protein UreD [Polyangiaceae bacterium]
MSAPEPRGAELRGAASREDAPRDAAPRTHAGHGRLEFEVVRDRTVIGAMRAESPLKVLAPRNHGHGAWVFAATFGGGLVAGDAIDLHVRVAEGACALIGTQASTKVYRCADETTRQDLTARVDAGATLVILPDPIVCFAGARYEQRTRVELSPDATLVLADTLTAGRSARGERWDFARYVSRLHIVRRQPSSSREVTPLVLDATLLDPAHGDLRARMGRFDAISAVLLVGPKARAMRESALADAHVNGKPTLARGADLRVATSAIGEDAALVRIAGTSVETVTRAVRTVLAGLPDLLGDDPFARKW